MERPVKKSKGKGSGKKKAKATLKLSKSKTEALAQADSGIQDALEKYRWYSHDGSRVSSWSLISLCVSYFLSTSINYCLLVSMVFGSLPMRMMWPGAT